jgi:LDH2 family malate/lactate/ureidoglycolate dehydrogenase
VFGNTSWRAAASSFLDELRQTPAQPDTAGVAVPGDRMRRARAAQTIELPDAVWTAARDLLTVTV